jgi:CubicO group peptidase (beta-lactamase class C family)
MSGEKRVLDLLLSGVTEGVFPGAVLLVAQSKEILVLEAVGKAAVLPIPRPMTHDTIFDLASLTKPLATGLVTANLLSRGKLRLDGSLVDLLPAASVPDDKQDITLRQLLCHCSGLPPWKPYYLFLDTFPQDRRKEQLRQQILKEPLDTAPGTRVAYSVSWRKTVGRTSITSLKRIYLDCWAVLLLSITP